MGWYEQAFGLDYIRLYSHRDRRESELFIESIKDLLSLHHGMKILDLCCGCGRYSYALSEKGYTVTGLDLSRDLLRCARREMCEIGLEIAFVRGDMRRLPFRESFDLVLNMFTSFGYFSEDDENLQTLSEVHRVLKRGGWTVIDFINKDYIRENLKARDEMRLDGMLVIQERYIDPSANRVIKNVTIRENETERQFTEKVKLYGFKDLSGMLRQAGFTVEHVAGNYDMSRFTAASPRLILLARKDKRI